MSAENTIMWAVRAPSRTMLGSSQRSLEPLAGGACCPLPKNPTPLLAFGLDFRHCPNSLHSPQCVFVRVLIKTLLVPIFGAKEFIRIHHFVLKYTKKYPGVATPRQGRNQGEGGRAPLRKLSALRWFWD